MKSKVSFAVAAILSGASLGAFAATPAPQSATAATPTTPTAPSTATNAPATTNTDLGALTEVVVTAQRRRQNIQDVPITMQALTSRTLSRLNISTFDDYIKFLPNVTVANNGPGQSEVFMRGLSAGSQASQGSGSTGLWPNVAVYLDDQSAQLPGRNLDVYAADMNRIEVLEGPQGTLFGAGAEAGVIRYITNKPNLDRTEGNVRAGYSITAHGDPNTSASAVLNLPLIAGKFAVRGVIYDDHRGGYINNVPATFSRSDTDIGIHYANYPAVNGQCPDGGANNGYCVPPGSPTVNNYAIAGRAINPVTYQGIRVEALYKFNDNWDALITQSYQNMDSQGVFYDQPTSSSGRTLSPLEVTLFNNAYNKDKFEDTAWTVHGKIGPLRAVYTGGYLDRNVDQTGDYTNYARGVYADYYQCYGPGTGYNSSLTSTCYSPSSTWHSAERNTHMQHEFRLSTPSTWRARGIVGVYYDDLKLWDQTDWRYRTVPSCTSNAPAGSPGNSACFATIGTVPGTTVQNPGLQTPNSSFYQDTMREAKQLAFYLSGSYDLIPHVLTLTAGTRHFRFQNSSVGSVTSSFGCFQGGVPAGGCANPAYSYNLNAQNLRDTESGWRSRANLSWHITPSVMVYYTFSQGYRPGGFNQNGGALHAPGPDGVDQYAVPKSYHPDTLTNNELGWKTVLLNHHLEWNGAIYREDWKDVQVEFFDPGLVGNIFYDTNGQNFVVKGIETSFIARLLPGLTLQGAASWNRSEQMNSPALIDNNPASANYGKPITELCSSAGANCAPVTNPFGPIGSPTADSPPMEFNLRMRYQFAPINGYFPSIEFGATHTDHSFTQAGANPTIAQAGSVSTARLRFENPSYTTYEASLGVSKGNWFVHLYGDNLANSHASTFISTDQFIVAQTPLRPRVIGMNWGYDF